jgi:hypothetical protein
MDKISRYLGLSRQCDGSYFKGHFGLSDTRSEKKHRNTFYTTNKTLSIISIKNTRTRAHTKCYSEENDIISSSTRIKALKALAKCRMNQTTLKEI